MTKRQHIIFAASLLVCSALAFMVGYSFGGEKKSTTYASSMGINEPVTGLMHVECNTGDPKGHRSLNARALGITFDKGGKTNILVELNDVSPSQYSPTEYWLKDAGLCQVYVR